MLTEKEKTFENIVHRNKDILWHVCQDYGLNAAWTPEDAFQEVLCDIWKEMDHFRGECSERTWVYKIATSRLLAIKRKRSNRPSEAIPSDFAPSCTPANLREIEWAIESLDEPDRTILRAKLDGFDYAEIATIAGVSASAVGMRLVRIKNKLKTILNHE